MERNRLGSAFGGGIFVVIGGRLIQNIFGAGGNLVPPILALGGLLVLFGVSVVFAAVQTRVSLRRLLGYEIVASSVGLFAISGYVAVLAFGGRGALAEFFTGLGVVGMFLSVFFIVLIEINRR